MTNLSPCPFCGGEAKRHDIEAREDIDNAGASYIECSECGACTQLHFDRKENLLDSWNRRAVLVELNDAALRALEAIDSEVVLTGQLKDMVDGILAGVAEQSGAGAPETSVRCGAPAAPSSPIMGEDR